MEKIETFEDFKFSGVYGILNVANNKIYIGSSNDICRRLYSHIKSLRSNKSGNVKLQRAFNKYGENSFEFYLIEITGKDLLDREQYYLDLYRSYENGTGYNICKKAGSCLGRRATEEEKLRRSIAIKKAYAESSTYREKTAEAKRGDKNPMFGKKQSIELIEKRIKNQRGKNLTSERKQKISDSLKGRRRTEEERKKMSKPRSAQGKSNIAESMLKRTKIIYQYSENWELIKIWNHSKEIQEELGILRTTISGYARKDSFFKGFFWSYKSN